MSGTPIIIQIQQDCLNDSASITSTLRKAKVAATKLELSEFLKWINNELNGYDSTENLPDYRDLRANVETQNIYTGQWLPVIATNEETSELITRAAILQSLGTLEDLIKNDPSINSDIILPYAPSAKAILADTFQNQGDYRRAMSKGSIVGIIEAVRNLLLDWTLELEKAGTVGEAMTFGKEEKQEAQKVTQIITAQHINHLGNNSDYATTTNFLSIESIDLKKVKDLISDIQNTSAHLPDDIKKEVDTSLKALSTELQNEQTDEKKIKSKLISLKNICENATGNLTAQGIVSLISKLLGIGG